MARSSPLAARSGRRHNLSAAVFALVAAIAAASAIAAVDAARGTPIVSPMADTTDREPLGAPAATNTVSPSSGAKDASGSDQVDPNLFFPKPPPPKPAPFNGVCPTETIAVFASLNTTTCGTNTTSPDTPAGALGDSTFTVFPNGTFTNTTTSGVNVTLRDSEVLNSLDGVVYWRYTAYIKCPAGWSYVQAGVEPTASDGPQNDDLLQTPNAIVASGSVGTRNPPNEFFASGVVGLRRAGQPSPTTCDIYNNSQFVFMQITCCKQVP